MSGFFWNIRGFNKSNKQSVVRDWVKSQSFQFGCLLETKVKEGKAMRVANSVFKHWNMVSNYEFHRLGRIWVVWSPQVQVQVIYKSAQLITCLIKLPTTVEEFCCSFIYASNFANDRKELWSDLQNHHDIVSFRGKPWLILGDFNETLDITDHSGSASRPMFTAGMRDFQHTVHYCSLLNLRTYGPLFTWSNRQDEGLISKKLDRVLQNMAWSNSFPQSYCVMDSGGCSDHLRGRFFLSSQIQKPRGPFKFTNVIASQPDFLQRVEDYWKGTPELYHSTSTLYRFSKKLKLLKPILRAMSCHKLSDISRRVAESYDDLCTKQINCLSSSSSQAVVEEKLAFARWEKVADLEEKFLKQRSKLHWLQVGDKNNRFFYNSTKERQSMNSIHAVTDPSGSLLTAPEDIKSEAIRSSRTSSPGNLQSSLAYLLRVSGTYFLFVAPHSSNLI